MIESELDKAYAAAERIEMGPKDDTLPVPSVAVTKTEAQRIKALQARFPGWVIHRVFGGWEAIPYGMAVVRGVYLESIEEKLEALEARSGDLASDDPGRSDVRSAGLPTRMAILPIATLRQ